MRRLHPFVTPVLSALGLCALALPSFATVEPELTTAIRHKDVQRVQTLLSEGVAVDERDEGAEQTPLMWAARTGSASIVQNLLNHGAAINAKDDFGNTALDFALSTKHAQVAKLLLSHGAKTGMGAREARNFAPAPRRTKGAEIATSSVPR